VDPRNIFLKLFLGVVAFTINA